MEKILEALKNLLPKDQLNEVASAVDEILAEAKVELETEFNKKLEEAYTELSAELSNAEKVAEQGYQEAYTVINDLRNRLEVQREEFEKTLEEGYEEAYQLLEAQKAKNSALEVDMYDEYDNKLNEMKEYIVDKVDLFLQSKGAEIYEQAKRDILNDPRMASHKVTLEKVVEDISDFLSDEDYAFATSSKLDEATRHIEELKANIKMMEARNINLDRQNRKLNESVKRQQEQLLTESRSEKKERAQKAQKVSGRGQQQVEETVVIAEHQNNGSRKSEVQEENTNLLESIGLDRDTVNLLAGTKRQN